MKRTSKVQLDIYFNIYTFLEREPMPESKFDGSKMASTILLLEMLMITNLNLIICSYIYKNLEYKHIYTNIFKITIYLMP